MQMNSKATPHQMTKPDMRILSAVRLFNQQRWRDALLLFEAVWLRTRHPEHKALVQLANIVLQLHLGFYKSPRLLIPKARALLSQASPCTGIDIAGLMHSLYLLAALIPEHDDDSFQVTAIPDIQIRWMYGNS